MKIIVKILLVILLFFYFVPAKCQDSISNSIELLSWNELDSISDEMMQERSLQTGATPTEKKI
ncbi:MAG: hypothetical protein ACI85I_001192 [Arenicella sp.]|jgi:hypothetical protein